MDLVFPAPEIVTVPTSDGCRFPVRRVFCVGKNYADHVREMGGDPARQEPVFFTKPADAICPGGDIPFPLATGNLHYEAELVVALRGGGATLAPADAVDAIYGYAVGCDLTRRDLQARMKERGLPWDIAKALDDGAVIGPIRPMPGTLIDDGVVRLSVNGAVKQDARLSAMIWSVPEIIARLSGLFELRPGDLIYTGTPDGVGQIVKGDSVRIDIDGLTGVEFQLV